MGGGYPGRSLGYRHRRSSYGAIYSFLFGSRVAANMGAIGGNSAAGSRHDDELRAETPFLTAEVGGGNQDTYHRRPVLAVGDVAATIPVMIGSGVISSAITLYQGGRIPTGS